MDYRDRPVFDFRPDFKGESVDHGQLDDHSYDSPSGGAAIPWKVTTGPKRTLALPFIIYDYEDLKVFRAFIAAREGRRTGFWLPTWLTDYVPVADAAQDALTITVKNVGIGTKLAFGTQFRHVAIITPTKMELYRIDGSAVDGDGNEELTLDAALVTPMVANQSVICGVLFARLADDEVEYEYLAGNVARVSLKFVELPKETEGTMHEGTKPCFLYVVTQGSVVWRATNFPISINVDSVDYGAQPIEHGDITEDIEFSSDPFMLDMATDDATNPIRNFLDPAFIQLTSLEIYEVADAANPVPGDVAAPIYKGRIERAALNEKGGMTVECSTLLRISETEVPQALSERTCIHRTFDGNCGLNPAAFTTEGILTGLSSGAAPYIEADEFGDKATLEADPNWFALGVVTIGAEQRMCTGQDGNRLYLNAPFRSAVIGNSAFAQAGDDYRIETCHNKFNNVTGNNKGFLGFPWMPNKNPQFEALEAPKPAGGKK